VNMLDWSISTSRSGTAHELTSRSRTSIPTWKNGRPDPRTMSRKTRPATPDHLAKDEWTPPRAVAEGQATAVMMDYILKPMGRSLLKDPRSRTF